jgi:hypothetical protein
MRRRGEKESRYGRSFADRCRLEQLLVDVLLYLYLYLYLYLGDRAAPGSRATDRLATA